MNPPKSLYWHPWAKQVVQYCRLCAKTCILSVWCGYSIVSNQNMCKCLRMIYFNVIAQFVTVLTVPCCLGQRLISIDHMQNMNMSFFCWLLSSRVPRVARDIKGCRCHVKQLRVELLEQLRSVRLIISLF